jgi:hypothetical protein
LLLATLAHNMRKQTPNKVSERPAFLVSPLGELGPHRRLDLNRQPLTARLRIIRHGCSPNFCAKLQASKKIGNAPTRPARQYVAEFRPLAIDEDGRG